MQARFRMLHHFKKKRCYVSCVLQCFWSEGWWCPSPFSLIINKYPCTQHPFVVYHIPIRIYSVPLLIHDNIHSLCVHYAFIIIDLDLTVGNLINYYWSAFNTLIFDFIFHYIVFYCFMVTLILFLFAYFDFIGSISKFCS